MVVDGIVIVWDVSVVVVAVACLVVVGVVVVVDGFVMMTGVSVVVVAIACVVVVGVVVVVADVSIVVA